MNLGLLHHQIQMQPGGSMGAPTEHCQPFGQAGQWQMGAVVVVGLNEEEHDLNDVVEVQEALLRPLGQAPPSHTLTGAANQTLMRCFPRPSVLAVPVWGSHPSSSSHQRTS